MNKLFKNKLITHFGRKESNPDINISKCSIGYSMF